MQFLCGAPPPLDMRPSIGAGDDTVSPSAEQRWPMTQVSDEAQLGEGRHPPRSRVAVAVTGVSSTEAWQLPAVRLLTRAQDAAQGASKFSLRVLAERNGPGTLRRPYSPTAALSRLSGLQEALPRRSGVSNGFRVAYLSRTDLVNSLV